ncbi:MAG: amidohydrolase family protein [Pseudomonadota bacterium]
MQAVPASILTFGMLFTLIVSPAHADSSGETGGSCSNGAFTVYADFAAGNLGRCEVRKKRIILHVEPEDAPPINPSPWYSFRISGSGTAQIELDYGEAKHRYWPKTSTDGRNWQRLERKRVKLLDERSRLRLKLNVRGELYVSAQEVMNSAWYSTWLDTLKQSYPDLAIQVFGKSKAGAPLWMAESNPGAKQSVLLVGRQHPPEVTGAIAMVAFVEELLAMRGVSCDGDSLCEFAEQTNIVFAPLLNPDGVDRGHWRHSLGGLDLNRDWGPFTQPETQAVKRLIDALAAQTTIRAFFDFHSTRRNLFYTQLSTDPTWPKNFGAKWMQRAKREGIYDFSPEPRPNNGSPTSKNYMYGRFGIPAITYEVGDHTPRQEIRDSARVLARAMVAELFPYQDPYDLLIRGGTVVDGTGAPPRIANVGVRGRHIAYVGAAEIQAEQVIDAAGLYVSPGFIDPHTHATGDVSNADAALNLPYLHQGVSTVVIGNDGGGKSPAVMLDQLARSKLGTNVAMLVGHGYLRRQHVGPDDRPATAAELQAMRTELREAMRDGALGLSSGLFYAPGSYADIDEVAALAQEAGRAHGYYDTHMRDEGSYTIGLLAAVEEVLEVGRRAKLPVHIAHIKALGPDVHGQSQAVIDLVNKARAEGLQVSADQYPWIASGTRLSNALVPRSLQSGGVQAMRAVLSRDLSDSLRNAMAANLKRRGGADKLLITGEVPYRGQTLAEIAAVRETDVLETARDIVLDGDPAIASFMMTRADLGAFAAQPWVVTGSDGSQGHPRKYATFPKRYQDLVLSGQVPVEDFVQRSSARTAEILGMCDRGRLHPGLVADIAIWHPQQYQPQATYQAPRELATGVVHMLVEGKRVIDAGQVTGVSPGRYLMRQACRPRYAW